MAADIQDMIDAVFTALDADAGIAAIAGEKVYHQQGEQNVAPPLVIYDVLSMAIEHDMTGGEFYRVDLSVAGWVPIDNGVTGAAGSGTLEEAIYDFLDKRTVTATGFTSGKIRVFNRSQRTVDDDAIRVQVDAVLEAYAATP